jgi:hypothetical protein
LSLTPLWKDLDWYMEPRRPDPLRIGRWWLIYDSPINQYIARQYFRFRTGGDEAAWRRVERESDAFVRHCLAAREILRVALTLPGLGCHTAAEFLAQVLAAHRLARDWRDQGPFLILVPCDSAFDGSPPEPADRRKATAMIRAHLVPLADVGASNTSTRIHVRTLAGVDVVIDGVPGPDRGIACGDHRVLVIDRAITESIDNGHARVSARAVQGLRVLSKEHTMRRPEVVE